MRSLNATLNSQKIIELARVIEGETVGYLGCGSSGFLIEPLAHKVGVTGRVYAVDVLPEALSVVSRISKANNLLQIKTVWSNLEVFRGTDVPDKSLDVTFLITMLYQNKDVNKVLQEVTRLVKSNGLVMIVEWLPGVGGFGPVDSLRIAPERLDSIMESMSYEALQGQVLTSYHYYRLYKKL